MRLSYRASEKKDTKNRLTVSTHSSVQLQSPAEWVSQAEAARIRGVSRQAIAKLVKKGKFRVLAIAGKVVVWRKDVEAYRPEPGGRRPRGE
jgi:predicted DNA-binding protein (UPF0251 family)